MTASTITDTLVSSVRVGQRIQWKQGTTTVTAITPDGRGYVRLTYRADDATVKADGGVRHNVAAPRFRLTDTVPVVDGPAVHAGCVHAGWDRNVECVEG